MLNNLTKVFPVVDSFAKPCRRSDGQMEVFNKLAQAQIANVSDKPEIENPTQGIYKVRNINSMS